MVRMALQAIQRLHDQYNVVEEVVSSLEVRLKALSKSVKESIEGDHSLSNWAG